MSVIQLNNPLERLWLLVLWACLLFGGFVFGKSDGPAQMLIVFAVNSALMVVVHSW